MWTSIADLLPGRTGVKCRERFVNVLDPTMQPAKHRPWTPAEDVKLFDLVEKLGAGKWSQIAKEMGDRSDNQCYRRWKNKAPPELLIKYKEKVAVKRERIPGNFVGRKRSRPDIESILDEGLPRDDSGKICV